MDLRMAVMAGGDAIVRTSCQNLVQLHFAVFMTRLGKARLQVSAATAAAVIVGFIGVHIHKIFFPDHGLDHKTEVICYWVTKGFSYQLAGVLDRKFDLQVLVPIGIYLKLSFPDPLCIKLNDALNFKVVGNVEFFQSGPDCK